MTHSNSKATIKPTEGPNLAQGGPITAASWANFVERLRHDCLGEGVRDHGTADAIFLVEKKVLVLGIDRDFTDNVAVIVDGSHYTDPVDLWETLGDNARKDLDLSADEMVDRPFLELDSSDQWDVLKDCDYTVTGWDERWEYVSAHFTKEAAERFIKRKGHDYHGLRVMVDAQSYSWEFNAIKTAILDGTLAFNGEAEEDRPVDPEDRQTAPSSRPRG